jgi:hypothetical protein
LLALQNMQRRGRGYEVAASRPGGWRGTLCALKEGGVVAKRIAQLDRQAGESPKPQEFI